MNTIYIVEVESGCSDDGGALLFDSAWTTKEAAEEYCKKFQRNPACWHSQNWNYEISKCKLDGSK